MPKGVGVAREILFLRGEMANNVWGNNVWGCIKFVRSITQKRNFVGECQKVGGNTKISGKPRSHVLYTSTGRHFGVTVTL